MKTRFLAILVITCISGLLTFQLIDEHFKTKIPQASLAQIVKFQNALERAEPGDFVNMNGNTFMIEKIGENCQSVVLTGRDQKTHAILNYGLTSELGKLPFDRASVIHKDTPAWNEIATWFYIQ
jgi:hypothetical protein